MHDYPCVNYVIRRMLKVIPLTEEKLIYDLNLFLGKMWNQAPEVTMSEEYWNYLNVILNKYLSTLPEEIVNKIRIVYNNESSNT
uniref:Uncharacterized protein n=1 Tax=viral metagenome TaxID=1070528 RepID=A0A6C0IE56_9ZZZZ